MLIIKMTGGIGNQMFQYALYKSLEDLGYEVSIDNSSFKKVHKHEERDIRDIFPMLHFIKSSPGDVSRLADLNRGYLHRIRRRAFGKYKTHIYENELTFKDQILHIKGDHYLDGYWQSEKYFHQIAPLLRSVFSFVSTAEGKNKSLQEELSKQASVGIHVRKGTDFQSKSRINICNASYYLSAIEKIKSQVPDAVFYVFSDNIPWCQENLNSVPCHYVDWNPSHGHDNHLDMQMLSYCKHNIIANSSYSWWAAWLNKNPDKIVVAPKVWYNEHTTPFNINDIIPSSWITL